MSIGHFIRSLFFGPEDKAEEAGEKQEWRDSVHNNRNEIMKLTGAAKISKKATDEAIRVQQKAIRLLECIWDGAKKE